MPFKLIFCYGQSSLFEISDYLVKQERATFHAKALANPLQSLRFLYEEPAFHKFFIHSMRPLTKRSQVT